MTAERQPDAWQTVLGRGDCLMARPIWLQAPAERVKKPQHRFLCMPPRGSGLPDLSQRPRREAPGMLTALAILERELGAAHYERHLVMEMLGDASGPASLRQLKARLSELDTRIDQVTERLDQEHQTWEDRQALRKAAG